MLALRRSQFIGICLGLFALLLWFVLARFPELAEHGYARRFYPFLANVISWVGNAMPFAFTGLVFAGFSAWLLWIPLREFLARDSMFAWLVPAILSMLSSLGLLLFLTCVSFLYNHHRYSEEKLYGLDFSLDESMYRQVVAHSVTEANQLSDYYAVDERGCSDIAFSLEQFDGLIKSEQANFLDRCHGRLFTAAKQPRDPLARGDERTQRDGQAVDAVGDGRRERRRIGNPHRLGHDLREQQHCEREDDRKHPESAFIEHVLVRRTGHGSTDGVCHRVDDQDGRDGDVDVPLEAA